MKYRPLSLAVAALFALPVTAADLATTTLTEIVVTAPQMQEPLTVTADPKVPYQPAPANDGAAFLKNIPGFTMIRKGGTDGDPVLRGMAGSRLNILQDGAELLGGCPMRMDPPTAYVFPETFDSVTVLKGPQTVSHGNGNLAGVVLFERDEDKAAKLGARGYASLTLGSWSRVDALIGGTYATDKFFVQANGSHAEAGDYKDGDGTRVHSSYLRESVNAKAGWNIDATTRLTLDAVKSQAEAAYSDRTMDGSQFDRDGYGLKFEKKHLSSLVNKVDAQVYYNHVDHIMDNYTLRTPPLSMGMYSASAMDVDRKTRGARLSTDLNLGASDQLKIGADWQTNVHSGRMGMGMAATASAAGIAATANYLGKPKLKDVETDITGIYSELRHDLDDQARLIGGLRFDSWHADRYNNSVNPVVLMRTADEDLQSMFLRYERDLTSSPATFFVGLGHAERPMDYWEMKTYNGLSTSALVPILKPEASTQLDTGMSWKTQDVAASVSLFYASLNDYLLTYSGSTIGQCDADIAISSGMYSCAFNVDVTRYGGEADVAWRFMPGFTLRGVLSYVHADNDSMNVPLAQTPPLEARLGLDYNTGAWSFGGVVRMVAEQDRVQVGYGNIVGQDYGSTPGFATLALNGAYKPSKKLTVSAGIDNVLDKTYSEHLARDNSFEAGTSTRVNESGRFLWAKLNLNFE